MQIIAFGHRKRVGKDKASTFLITELRMRSLPLRIVRAGFADKVKDVAHQIYAWAGLMPGEFYELPENEYLKEVVLPLIGRSPRQVWIGVGNGVRGAVGYDGTWKDYLLRSTRADLLVVKDLRFPAEAEGVLSLGGWVYRIDNPRAPVVVDGADEPLADWRGWTGVVDNSGTLNDLHAAVAAIARRHFP